MSITNFLIRVLFLVLPGIICSSLYRKITGKTEKKDWEDFLEIGVFSIVSYGLYGLFLAILSTLFGTEFPFVFFDAIVDDSRPLEWAEIVGASIAGIITAFGAAFFHTYKIINKVGRFLRVTHRYGDDDIWNFFHNMPNLDWVIVRDHKLDLIYFAWIELYSDSGRERELTLRDVQVYSNSTGEARFGRCIFREIAMT